MLLSAMVRLCAAGLSVEETVYSVCVCVFRVILRRNEYHFPELSYFVIVTET